MDHFTAAGLAAVIVSLCILIEYESLNLLERLSRWLKRHRWIVVITMGGLIVSHIVQMWVFALGYYLGEKWFGFGALTGSTGLWMEYVYYSATVYTTLGFGDITPTSDGLRMLTMAEVLAGFSLITWSASFTFLQMQRLWRP